MKRGGGPLGSRSMTKLFLQPGRLRGVRGALLLAAALAACVIAPTGALGATKHVPKAPSGLAFYSPPARLVAGKPGTVIWSRTVATPQALTSAARATLVLYLSLIHISEPT